MVRTIKLLIISISLMFAISLFLLRVDSSIAQSTNSPPPNFKVAFIGDQGHPANNDGLNPENVLKLIKSEGAQMVLHQGDFDYTNNPSNFENLINSVLGPNFPYFASIGNHDDYTPAILAGYQQNLQARIARVGASCTGSVGVKTYCKFNGLSFVLSGVGTIKTETGYEQHIQSSFANDPAIWKICSWHQNLSTMQLGLKSDATGWGVYETCRQMGAIIATAHEHSYQRSKTLTSMQNHTVDTSCQNLTTTQDQDVCVSPGKSFVFVSGLGGNSMRNQDRCLSSNFTSDCNQWAKIYTTNQTGGVQKYGALFIVFNYQGNPNKAHAYFKNTDGQITDEFDITTTAANITPPQTTPTYTPTPGGSTPTKTPTPPSVSPTKTSTPQPGCPLKSKGDADCNGKIDLVDFEIWRKEANGILTTKTADFDASATVNIVDFEIWRKGFYSTLGTPTPTTPLGACETRGVWLNKAAFATSAVQTATFNNIKKANLNTVFLISYPLNNNWGHSDKASFDAMYNMLRQAGISVHVWLDSFKRINGDPTVMDYSKSSEWDTQAQWALDFLNAYPDISGVHYDNLRYNTGSADQTRITHLYNTVKTIHEKVKVKYPNRFLSFYGGQVDPIALTSGFYQPQWWKNWVASHPTNLLKFGGTQYRPDNLKYDHIGWVMNGWMDAFMPGEYSTSVELWKLRIDIWKQLWDGANANLIDKVFFGLPWMVDKPGIAYPDGKSYPGGGANAATAVQQIKETRAAGMKGVVIFQFGKLADDTPIVNALTVDSSTNGFNAPYKQPAPSCLQ